MTTSELVQLYAPFAGLVGVVFWLGVLTERQKQHGKDIARLQDPDAIAESPAVVRLATEVQGLASSVGQLARSTESIQRQLANLISRGLTGKVVEFGD